MQVWTGAGYEELPVYDAADFGMYGTLGQDPGADGSGMVYDWQTGGYVPWNTPTWGMSPEARAKYGDLFGGANPNNWMMASGGQGGMDFLLKSGDKEGTRVSYTLQDGKYVPSIAGTQQWNTNVTAKDYMPLAILGGGLAAAFAAPATAAAAGGGAAAGSAPGWAGAGLFDAAAAGGGVGGWIAPQGLAAAGAGSLAGTGWKGAGLYDAAVGGGGTSGWIGAEGMVPGAASGLLDKIPKALQDPSVLSSLGKVGGLLAGGILGANSTPSQGQAAVQQPVPQMYGGNASAPQFQTVGNTETERRMTQQYLPGLFAQGQGLLGGMVPPIRRNLLGGEKWDY